MKLLAPLMMGTALASQRIDNVKQTSSDGASTLLCSLDFDGAAGRIKAWETAKGEAGGYIEIRQLGVKVVDADGKEGENFNFAAEFDWAPFPEVPVPCPGTGGDSNCNVYSTHIQAVNGAQTMRLDVVITESGATTKVASFCTVGADAQCTNTACPSGACTCYKSDSPDPTLGSSDFCGGTSWVKSARGADVEVCTGNLPNTTNGGGYQKCHKNVVTVGATTVLDFNFDGFDNISPGSHLRYTAEIKAREGTEHAKKGDKVQKHGKWVIPVGLPSGEFDWAPTATFHRTDGTTEGDVIVSDPVYNGYAAVITIDFPEYPAGGGLLEYSSSAITVRDLSEYTGDSTVIASSFITVVALFAALF